MTGRKYTIDIPNSNWYTLNKLKYVELLNVCVFLFLQLLVVIPHSFVLFHWIARKTILVASWHLSLWLKIQMCDFYLLQTWHPSISVAKTISFIYDLFIYHFPLFHFSYNYPWRSRSILFNTLTCHLRRLNGARSSGRDRVNRVPVS